MKKKVRVILAAALILPFLLGSCGMGLEPAKTGTTSVTLSFASLPGTEEVSSSGRAIIPNGGYLYVRMVNSTATPGYYGPYKLTGSPTAKISITDIPAGSYSAMYLLYSSKEIHNEIVTDDGKTLTFGELFGSLVDNPSENDGENSEGGEDDDIDLLFDGKASFGFYNKPEIRRGTTNSFPITMTPLTHYRIESDDGNWTLTNALYGNTGTSFNGFVRLSSLSALFSGFPSESLQVVLTLRNWGKTLTLNRIDSYDDEGSFINKGLNQPVTLASGTDFDFIVPYEGGDEMYFYMDLAGGTPIVTVEPTVNLGGASTPITGTLIFGNYSYFFDTISSVLFTNEREGEGFVGIATVENTIDGLTLSGSILTTSLNKSVYITITGEKYGTPVMYVEGNQITAAEIVNIQLTSIFAVLHYAVFTSGSDGQGFAPYLGKSGNVTIKQGELEVLSIPAKIITANLGNFDLQGELHYCAIVPIPPLQQGNYSFEFDGPWGPPVKKQTQYTEGPYEAFIGVVYDW